MFVYIVRHGKAETDSPTGDDFDRALIDRGRRQAERLGDYLASIGEKSPTRIYSSGLVRALETARILEQRIGVRLEVDPCLETGQPVSAVVELIRRFDGADGPAVLVGHNPQLEHLVSTLINGPASEPVRLRTGEAVLLDIDPERPLGGSTLVDTMRFDER